MLNLPSNGQQKDVDPISEQASGNPRSPVRDSMTGLAGALNPTTKRAEYIMLGGVDPLRQHDSRDAQHASGRRQSSISGLTQEALALHNMQLRTSYAYASQEPKTPPPPASVEEHNDLSPPVPISKEQPTWDPYDTAPIVEEADSEVSDTKPEPEFKSAKEMQRAKAPPELPKLTTPPVKTGEYRNYEAIISPSPIARMISSRGKDSPGYSTAFMVSKDRRRDSEHISDEPPRIGTLPRRASLPSSRPDLSKSLPAYPDVWASRIHHSNSDAMLEQHSNKSDMARDTSRERSFDVNLDPVSPLSMSSSTRSRPRGFSASRVQPGSIRPGLITASGTAVRGASLDTSRDQSGNTTLSKDEAARIWKSISLDTKSPLLRSGNFEQTQLSPLSPSQASINRESLDSPTKQGSFRGLPPLRRTSMFGFGFGSRQPKERFTIDDDDEDGPSPTNKARLDMTQESLNALDKQAVGHHDEKVDPPKQSLRAEPPSVERLTSNIMQAPSPQTSPQILRLARGPGKASPLLLPHGSPDSIWEPQQSQISHLPTRSRASTAQSLFPDSSPTIQHRSPKNHVYKAFEEPPSSAHRYPELFPSDRGVPAVDAADVPHNYLQRPISREESFFARQQGSEFEIEGVGPPEEIPTAASSRRNSLIRELSGRIARSTSLDRSKSKSPHEAPFAQVLTGGKTDTDGNFEKETQPSPPRRPRRPSLLGTLTRASTGGLSTTKSFTSAQLPWSRPSVDLGQPRQTNSPRTQQPPESRRSVLGIPSEPERMIRNVPHTPSASADKKHRFSTLKNIFSKSSPSKESFSVQPKDASQVRNTPSPASHPEHEQAPGSEPPRHAKKLIARFSPASKPQAATQSRRSRRPSASGLLSGFLGKLKPQDEQRGPTYVSGSSQQDLDHFLHAQVDDASPSPHDFGEDPSAQHKKQGQYSMRSQSVRPDSETDMATSGGYPSVQVSRGQPVHNGNEVHDTSTSSSSTRADQDQSPAAEPVRDQAASEEKRRTSSQLSPGSHHGFRPAPIDTDDVNSAYEMRRLHRRNLSSEDMIARSPARVPRDQQTPYQISLPKDADPSSSADAERGRSRAKTDAPKSAPLPRTEDELLQSRRPKASSVSGPMEQRLGTSTQYSLPAFTSTFKEGDGGLGIGLFFPSDTLPSNSTTTVGGNAHSAQDIGALGRRDTERSTVSQVSKLSSNYNAEQAANYPSPSSIAISPQTSPSTNRYATGMSVRTMDSMPHSVAAKVSEFGSAVQSSKDTEHPGRGKDDNVRKSGDVHLSPIPSPGSQIESTASSEVFPERSRSRGAGSTRHRSRGRDVRQVSEAHSPDTEDELPRAQPKISLAPPQIAMSRPLSLTLSPLTTYISERQLGEKASKAELNMPVRTIATPRLGPSNTPPDRTPSLDQRDTDKTLPGLTPSASPIPTTTRSRESSPGLSLAMVQSEDQTLLAASPGSKSADSRLEAKDSEGLQVVADTAANNEPLSPDEAPKPMNAASYPGMEWNPFSQDFH